MTIPPRLPVEENLVHELIISRRFTLGGLLGEDWKERCIYSKDRRDREENPVIRFLELLNKQTDEQNTEYWPTVSSQTQCKCDTLNTFFKQKNMPCVAFPILFQGEEKIFIRGTIGKTNGEEDRFMIIADPGYFLDYVKNGYRYVCVSPEIFCMEGKDGMCLVNELQALEGSAVFVVSNEPQESYEKMAFVGYIGSEMKPVSFFTQFPTTYNFLLNFFHELAHFLLSEYRKEAVDKYKLPPSLIKPRIERSASAIALALLRQIGRAIGCNFATPAIIKTLKDYVEECLTTYDTEESSLSPESYPHTPFTQFITAFSSTLRKLRRKSRKLPK
uniref:Uncharacterized protein n=1 Tax=candidate division CPR3 bacterium TaxID=2268181 RepID=A0A7C5UT50_UNCC3